MAFHFLAWSPSMSSDAVPFTLSKLRSECDLCGEWSPFTGKTEVRAGRTSVIVRCPNGDGEFSVWKRDNEALVLAFQRAQETVTDSASYRNAFPILVGADAGAVAALVTSPPAELPLFSIEDVPLGRAYAVRWSELVLEWPGWRPLPDHLLRVEEALATALKYDEKSCVERVVAWAHQDAIGAVQDKLRRRFAFKYPGVLAAATL
jgi:hypothetical protein